VTNAILILDVAIGYVAGKLLWELALVGAHQVGRLAVRLVMRLVRQEVKPPIVAEIES
jgi:hypothetical protein